MSGVECEVLFNWLGLINDKEYTNRFFIGCECYSPSKIRVHNAIGI